MNPNEVEMGYMNRNEGKMGYIDLNKGRMGYMNQNEGRMELVSHKPATEIVILCSITTTQGEIKITGHFTCTTNQPICCISCRKCPGIVYIGKTSRRLGDRF